MQTYDSVVIDELYERCGGLPGGWQAPYFKGDCLFVYPHTNMCSFRVPLIDHLQGLVVKYPEAHGAGKSFRIDFREFQKGLQYNFGDGITYAEGVDVVPDSFGEYFSMQVWFRFDEGLNCWMVTQHQRGDR